MLSGPLPTHNNPTSTRRTCASPTHRHQKCMGQLRELMLSAAASDEPLPFPVRCADLLAFDPSLAYSLLHYPKLLLPIFGDTIFEMQVTHLLTCLLDYLLT